MITIRYILFLVVTSLFVNQVQAQGWQVGANVKVYDPQGAFEKNMNRMPVGLSISGIKQTPGRFSYGLEMGVAMYTNDKYTYDLSSDGYPGQTLLVDEEDCFWSMHAVLRYETFSTPSVRQYLELRVGGTTFFSSIVALEEHNTSFRDQFDFHDTAFNTGFGTGISFNPASIFSGGERQGSLWIDLGLNVHSGSEASYRNFELSEEEQLSQEDGNYTSLTHYIDYRLGFLVQL